MKFIKRAFGEKEMTTSVRLVLSYDFLKRIYRLRSGHISMKIYIVIMDVGNDVTYSRKSVNTRVVI